MVLKYQNLIMWLTLIIFILPMSIAAKKLVSRGPAVFLVKNWRCSETLPRGRVNL